MQEYSMPLYDFMCANKECKDKDLVIEVLTSFEDMPTCHKCLSKLTKIPCVSYGIVKGSNNPVKQ